MNSWKKDIATWKINGFLYMSVVFTWHLPRARALAIDHGDKRKVIVGGPAVLSMPDYLADVATVRESTPFPVLALHNPFATFTSRGCINKCGFCTVPKIEGPMVELTDWQVRPLICDNNFLATSRKHFDGVIDRLKSAGFPCVDFNQGLDARLFEDYHAKRLRELKGIKIRFAFDNAGQETIVVNAIKRARRHGLNDITVYVLTGFEDTPEDAIYRLELLRSLDVLSFPQRYQPLYALEKNSYVETSKGWTDELLKKVCTYYANLNNTITYFGKIPFDSWYNHCCEKGEIKARFGLKKGKKLAFDETTPLQVRQHSGASYTAEKKKKQTMAKLIKVFRAMEKKGVKLTQKTVAEKAAVSERTVQTYWSELKTCNSVVA